MESEEGAVGAAEQVRSYDRIQGNGGALRPARGYWVMLLWSAVATSSYIAVYLFVFGGFTAEQVAERTGGYSPAWVLLTPVLVFSLLVRGVGERFSVRSKGKRPQRITIALLVAGSVGLGILSLVGVTYPLWLNVALPLAILVAMSIEPIRGLASTPRSAAEAWGNVPLSTSGRVVTAAIGLALGVLLALAPFPLAAAISGMVVMLLLLVPMLSRGAAFSFPEVGFEWGSLHWAAFGVCAGIAFVCVVIVALNGGLAPAYGVAAGALVFAIMGAAAMLPRDRAARVA